MKETIELLEAEHPSKLALFDQGFEIVRYRDLSRPYQLAIAWYMAIDGEAWNDLIPFEEHTIPEYSTDVDAWRNLMLRLLDEAMPKFLESYGDVEFGVGLWSTENLLRSIVDDSDVDGTTFKEFRDSYKKPIRGLASSYYEEEKRWPSILSGFSDETFQDGWNRFHTYVSNGHCDDTRGVLSK